MTNKRCATASPPRTAGSAAGRRGFDPFYGAPAIILVLANKNEPNHVYDGSLMMGNMMLAAHALGLGSIWINRAKQEFDMPEYQTLLEELGIEGEWEGIAHLAVGYIDGKSRARRAENWQGVLGGITFLEKGLCPFSRRGGFAALCASAGR